MNNNYFPVGDRLPSNDTLNLIDEVYKLLKAHNGSPSAEHGIGQRKKEIWTKFDEYRDKYKLLQTLKKSMDPKNILSP